MTTTKYVPNHSLIQPQKRAAIYCRVSTDKQEEEGTSLDSQEALCLAYCTKQGYVVDACHIWREAYTGTLYRERPKLTQLRDAARNHAFDIVVVFAYDRLARKQIHQAVIIDDLEHHSVTLESITENFDDTALGQYMRSTYAFMAELDREKIIERLDRGKLTHVQQGKLLGNWQPLYGYTWNETRTGYVFNNTQILVDEDDFVWTEAEIVRFIFREVSSGRTIRSVSLSLTQKGIPTRKGKKIWRPSVLLQILRNKFYIGEVWVYKKRRAYAYSGVRILRPEEEQIRMPDGVVPPLIDIATFEIVQAQLQRNREQSKRNNKDPQATLLRAGLVVCGYCGFNMVVRHQLKKLGNKYYPSVSYSCGKGEQALGECRRVIIVSHIVDEAAWEHAVEIIKDPQLVAQKLAEKKRKNPTDGEFAPLERRDKRLKEIEDEVQNLVKLAQQAPFSIVLETTAKLLAGLERERQGLLQEHAKLTHIDKEFKKEQDALLVFEKRCETMRSQLENPDFEPTYEFKREALEYFGIKARVWRVDHKPHFIITYGPPSVVSVSSSR